MQFDFLSAGSTVIGGSVIGDDVNVSEALLEPNFQLPIVDNPMNFLQDTFAQEGAPKRIEFDHGTTTLGFVFQGGVVIAVDSRATRGPRIASQSVKKVIEINPYLLGTMAGGAADCAFWERRLGMIARIHELNNKERISVAAASKTLQNILYSYKNYGLSVGTMIAGWDNTGPNLHYVDSDGSRIKGNLFSVGSGSTYAYGILDSEYRFDLGVEEALELGRRAIWHATHRDAYSGGTINVYHVQADGWKKISANDMNDLYWDRYKLEEKQLPRR